MLYKYLTCYASTVNVIQVHQMSYKYIKCHTRTSNVIQEPQMSYKNIKCHTRTSNVIHVPTMLYMYKYLCQMSNKYLASSDFHISTQ